MTHDPSDFSFLSQASSPALGAMHISYTFMDGRPATLCIMSIYLGTSRGLFYVSSQRMRNCHIVFLNRIIFFIFLQCLRPGRSSALLYCLALSSSCQKLRPRILRWKLENLHAILLDTNHWFIRQKLLPLLNNWKKTLLLQPAKHKSSPVAGALGDLL